MKSYATLSIIALIASPFSTTAATLAAYVDGPEYADTSTPPADSSGGITASNMAFVGLSGGFGGPVRNTFGTVDLGGDGNVTSNDFWYVSNAQADLASDPGPTNNPIDDYFGFTISASDTLTSISLDSLTFDWGIGENSSSKTDANFGYRVFASIDGGAFNSIASGSVTTDINQGQWISLPSANIDLSGLPTTKNQGDIEFRIQTFSSSIDGGSINAFQNFAINGDVVAVPEPSSAALCGIGTLAFIMRRRK